jgi:antitoxin component YwqK of YwqJK toxin-antitoxin module
MARDGILDISEVMDESRKIRPNFHARDGSNYVPEGRYTVLRENGRPLLELTYRDGVVHGPYVDFWSNGKVACEGQHQEGKQEGIWHFYNEDGAIQAIIQFKQDKVINDSQYIYYDDGKLREIIQSNQFKHPKDGQ